MEPKAAFALVAVIALAVVLGIFNYSKRKAQPLVDGVQAPVLTGTKWLAKDTYNNRAFEVEFLHGDQRVDNQLRANVLTRVPLTASNGKYKGFHIEFEVEVEGEKKKFKADINPNDTDIMYGVFSSRVGNLNFSARPVATTQK